VGVESTRLAFSLTMTFRTISVCECGVLRATHLRVGGVEHPAGRGHTTATLFVGDVAGVRCVRFHVQPRGRVSTEDEPKARPSAATSVSRFGMYCEVRITRFKTASPGTLSTSGRSACMIADDRGV